MRYRRITGILTAFAFACSLLSAAPAASAGLLGYMGDINRDLTITVDDIKDLESHVLGVSAISAKNIEYGNLDKANEANCVDVLILKRIHLGTAESEAVYSQLITPPVEAIDNSCPSVGDVKMVMIAIDFPDCSFADGITASYIQNVAFGEENTSSRFYPLESSSAYFTRASFGAFSIDGDVYTYTAKNPLSSYQSNHESLIREAVTAIDKTVDFTQYNSDGDGYIDSAMFTVPPQASDDYWWPYSGGFSLYSFRADGLRLGNIIVGNSDPEDPWEFNSTVIHETGHSMGLPDYYKYNSSDWEGFHGSAGYEMMDDAVGDFSAFSKIMLGWYSESEISVFDSASSLPQTFSLASSQEKNNCVIIPRGELDSNYASEYFIIEYATPTENNAIGWFSGGGIRIMHIQADMSESIYGYYFSYDIYGQLYTSDDGIRVARLVNDGNGFFAENSAVNSSTAGFAWYAADETASVDTGLSISIGTLSDGEYTLTVSTN